jgi:hypothetical protein
MHWFCEGCWESFFLFGGVLKKNLTPSPSPKERGTRTYEVNGRGTKMEMLLVVVVYRYLEILGSYNSSSKG